MLVDSHCHLDFPDFAEERDAVLERARGAGVERFLTICTRLRRAGDIIAIAEAYPDVYASIGTHPDHAGEEMDLGKPMLLSLANNPKVAAIGECGLDYHNNESTPEDQHALFRQHIQASMETGLPLVIHTREAEADTIRILREELGGESPNGVFHCFTSSRQLAEQALELGFHISFSGIVTFKNAGDLRDTVKIVPLDRLLVETDAPFLAPMPYRGKRNEPAYVAFTAETVAMVKEIPTRQLAVQTTRNFYELFRRAA
jgi:TatD DNase family protein